MKLTDVQDRDDFFIYLREFDDLESELNRGALVTKMRELHAADHQNSWLVLIALISGHDKFLASYYLLEKMKLAENPMWGASILDEENYKVYQKLLQEKYGK